MERRFKVWLGGVTLVVVAAIASALFMPRSLALTALSDIIQFALLTSGALSFFPAAKLAHGRLRLFWSLLAAGVALWLCYQGFWTYYEVILQRDVPDLCAWDIVLFLHFVPFMAAISLRPHVPRDEYAARVGRLDFALLFVWWLYVYVLVVMPWQYAVPDIATYNRNLNWAYGAEKLAFLGGLLFCCLNSGGVWRRIYGSLFAMTLCYSAGSTFANWAIARGTYYSGSLYDIPLLVAMASLTWIGLQGRVQTPETEAPQAFTAYGVWVARCTMIAVFSLPLFAALTISDGQVPEKVRAFRLVLTFIAAFCLGLMVYARHQLLDRELVRLLDLSRTAFDNLKRLQAQILQSEKLASIGQLVGGAAHELNNPITAMLGYSDLLLNTALSGEQRPLAIKIGQYVRRTRSLVASLVSFARQAPAPKALLDLNTLARTSVKLSQPQWEGLQVEVRTQLDPDLPKVLGDSNQLLQVCMQLLANCFHLLAENGGRIVTISTLHRAGACVLKITTEALPTSPTKDGVTGLALSACQGILQEHRGRVCCDSNADGSFALTVELPASEVVKTQKEATVPVLWQSRPYA
ncbi:MAG TPA: histidine kinase dimerization/phospho-acceptor domain-containing protein [Candidatus Sulfotelmatobacter sp.]|nr:histidine kinase dimerization/phospho-acceptor domain-containing protein [Candidatus Sulfotelmatobacter sp.]